MAQTGQSEAIHSPDACASCFPNDVRALIKTAQDHEVPLRILEAVAAANDTRRRAMARKVGVVRDDARFPFTARRPRPPRDNDANWSRLHTRETPRSSINLPTRDEARRIAANSATLAALHKARATV